MSSHFDGVAALLAEAARARHRLLLCLSGERAWAEQQARTLLARLDATALWVDDTPPPDSDRVDFNASRRWLGREVEHLVFCAHGGFDPNIFSLLCGSVRAGGTLVLLTPALEAWADYPDPVNRRCGVWGATVTHSRYLTRLAQRLPQQSQWLWRQGGQPQPCLTPTPPAAEAHTNQSQIVDAVAVSLTFDTGPQLHIISGDRGRGKSAALGLIAAKLLRAGAPSVLLSAPRKAATEVLRRHAGRALGEGFDLDARLRFAAPDALVARRAEPEQVLLLDEMGGVHLGLLQRLLGRYPRLVMAGTVHGYEGAGRGFVARLRRHIDHTLPGAHWHALQQPVRWASGDPLEASCHDLMLLDAEPAPAVVAPLHYRLVDRDQLAGDESTLRQLHGLLAGAHYRTRPLDLRQMLDGPNIRVLLGEADGAVQAACLLALEGTLDDEPLNREILAGRRRPPGHLLPQLLMQRLGLAEAAAQRYWRVVRIAVHPQRQGQGLGSALLRELRRLAQRAEVDNLGSLFAVDAAVLRFWRRAGFTAVTMGDNCEATSGSYALTILQPLNTRAEALLAAAVRADDRARQQSLHLTHPALDAALARQLETAFAEARQALDGSMRG